MNQGRWIAALVTALLIGAAGVANADLTADQVNELQQRTDLINKMTERFQADAAAQAGAGFNAAEWKRDFGSRLLHQTPDTLSSALSATNLATAQNVLYSAASKGPAKHNTNNHLVINVLAAPCRILDTRGGGGGIFPGNAWRTYHVFARDRLRDDRLRGRCARRPRPAGTRGLTPGCERGRALPTIGCVPAEEAPHHTEADVSPAQGVNAARWHHRRGPCPAVGRYTCSIPAPPRCGGLPWRESSPPPGSSRPGRRSG